MSAFLGLDIGTSKLCVVAWDAEASQVLASIACANDADLPGEPGRHEQDPELTRRRCWELLGAIAAHGAVTREAIQGIGISGQMHGVLLADKQGTAITPFITWRDQRVLEESGAGSLSHARTALGEAMPGRAGCELHAGYGGATLAWLAAHGKTPKQAVAQSMADYVARSLCGVQATEPTHGASWGLMNLAAGMWDEESIECLGLPAGVLPVLRPSAQALGRLLPEAGELGLPATVMVHAPVGDNQASVIGAGLRPDTAVLNLGTGGQVSLPLSAFRYVQGMETRPMPFAGFISVGASLCGGWAYAYVCAFARKLVKAIAGVEVSEAEAYARLNELAARSERGAGGMRVDTRFSGTRGDPDRTGSFSHINRDNLTPENLARAVLEGMVQELADMAAQVGLTGVARIVGTGNAVRRNGAMPGIIESTFGLPCVVAEACEEAAVGAAMCAARAVGFPWPEAQSGDRA